VRLHAAEVDQHAAAHILRHESAEALRGLGDALLIGGNDLAGPWGSLRAERAVEPTRSANITVTWRRSAVSFGWGTTGAGVASAGATLSAAIARSSLRR
jgi:hypothetical protein